MFSIHLTIPSRRSSALHGSDTMGQFGEMACSPKLTSEAPGAVPLLGEGNRGLCYTGVEKPTNSNAAVGRIQQVD